MKTTRLIKMLAASLLAGMLLTGCGIQGPATFATSTAKLGTTTKEELVTRCGTPYKVTAARNDNMQEETLYYRVHDRDMPTYKIYVIHSFTFVNGRLQAIDNSEERVRILPADKTLDINVDKQ